MLVKYVSGAEARAFAGTETTQVVVVQSDIAAGAAVSSFGDAVALKTVPKGMVVDGALTDLTSVQDKVAAVKLLPGDQLSDLRLTDAATYTRTNPIEVPDTMQQLSFSVTADRVVGGQLQPGDNAAVFISYNQGVEPGTSEDPATKLTLRKALVVSMQAAGNDSSSAPTDGSTTEPATTAPSTVGPASWVVTVALAPADAVKLVHASEFGLIYVAKDVAGSAETSPAPLFKGDVFK